MGREDRGQWSVVLWSRSLVVVSGDGRWKMEERKEPDQSARPPKAAFFSLPQSRAGRRPVCRSRASGLVQFPDGRFKIRLEPQRRFEFRDGFIRVALQQVRGPQIVMRLNIIRLEPDRLAETVDRLRYTSLARQRVAQVVMGRGVRGRKTHRRLKIGHRFLEF